MKTVLRNLAGDFVSLALSVVLLILLSSSGEARTATQSKPPATRDTARYEAWLRKDVRHQLLLLPWYSVFDNLEYKVEGYKVTLLGQVVRPVLKDDAASAVKHIEGVEEVDNQIEVLPVSPNDDRIRRTEFRAIYSFEPLERYGFQAVPSIHIIVKNGQVTLEGAVASEADKNAAYIRANGVPGVFSVTNHLRVENS